MPSGRGLAYTVEVVDRTGKAIHTSKTLFDAIREAREAYRAKKAQRKEERERRASADAERIQRELRRRRQEERSIRGANSDEERERRHHHKHSEVSSSKDKGSRKLHSDRNALRRRATDDLALTTHSNMSSLTLATNISSSEPPSPTDIEHSVAAPIDNAALTKDDHLTALFVQCNEIFDSLSAFQCSVSTLIGALQRDPETLAVVGLTLAEISNLVTKLTPAVLASMKASWPMVFAFLASPQFAILAGVAGTTVVLVGGYKIVKRLMYGPSTPPEEVELGGRIVEEIEQRELPAPPPPAPAREAAAASTVSSSSSSRSSHRDKTKDSKEKKHKEKRSKTANELLAFPARRSSTQDDLAFGGDPISPIEARNTPTRSTTEPVRRHSGDHKKALPSTERVVPDLSFFIPRKSKNKSSRTDKTERSDRSDKGSDREKIHIRSLKGKEREKVHRREIRA